MHEPGLYVLLIEDMFVAFAEMPFLISIVFAWEHVFKHSLPLLSLFPLFIQCVVCLSLLSAWGLMAQFPGFASHGSGLYLGAGSSGTQPPFSDAVVNQYLSIDYYTLLPIKKKQNLHVSMVLLVMGTLHLPRNRQNNQQSQALKFHEVSHRYRSGHGFESC